MATVHTALTEPVRRLEVFTGAGLGGSGATRKARIVAEIVMSGEPALDGMDCRRSSCLAGAVSCEKQRAVISKKKCSLCRRWWMPWCRLQLLAVSARHRAARPRRIPRSSRSKLTALRSGLAVVRTRR